jgi:hypothetical protein
MLFLTILTVINFAGYSLSYLLDLYVIFSSAQGSAGMYKYWMHSVVDGGRSGYLQLGWLATY